ncbi:MAG: hypothetical protein SGBAC_007577 [Bacillariaceae sp.]
MEDDIDALPKSSQWWKVGDFPSASPNIRASNFRKISIKIPFPTSLRNKSTRKEQSTFIPDDSEPLMSSSAKKKDPIRVSGELDDAPPVALFTPRSTIFHTFQYKSRRKDQTVPMHQNVLDKQGTTASITQSSRKQKDDERGTTVELPLDRPGRGLAATATQDDEQTNSTLKAPSMRLFSCSEEAMDAELKTSLTPPSTAGVGVALVSYSDEFSDYETDSDRDKAMPLKPPSMATVTLGIEEDADSSTFDHHYGSLPLKPVEKPVELEQSSDFRDSNHFTSRKTRPPENEEVTLFTLTPFQQFDPTKLDAKQKPVARGKSKTREENSTLAALKLAEKANSKEQRPQQNPEEQQKEDPMPPKGKKQKKGKNRAKPKRRKKIDKQKACAPPSMPLSTSERTTTSSSTSDPKAPTSTTKPILKMDGPDVLVSHKQRRCSNRLERIQKRSSPARSRSNSGSSRFTRNNSGSSRSSQELVEHSEGTAARRSSIGSVRSVRGGSSRSTKGLAEYLERPSLKKDGPDVFVSLKQRLRSHRLERIQKRSSEARSRSNSGRSQSARNNRGSSQSSQSLSEHFKRTAVNQSSIGSVCSVRSDGFLVKSSRRSIGVDGDLSVGGAQQLASRTSANSQPSLRGSSKAGGNDSLAQSPGKRKDILQSPGTQKHKG